MKYNIIKFPNPLKLQYKETPYGIIYIWKNDDIYIEFYIDEYVNPLKDIIAFSQIIIKNKKLNNIVIFPEEIIIAEDHIKLDLDFYKQMFDYNGFEIYTQMKTNFNEYVKYFIIFNVILKNNNGKWTIY